MKKVAILLATVATLAAVATAPAEARGRQIQHRISSGAATAGLVTGALVAATVASQYGYGPAYYGPGYYAGPVYGGYLPYSPY